MAEYQVKIRHTDMNIVIYYNLISRFKKKIRTGINWKSLISVIISIHIEFSMYNAYVTSSPI